LNPTGGGPADKPGPELGGHAQHTRYTPGGRSKSSSMRSLDQSPFLQLFKIAPDGRTTDLKLLGKLRHIDCPLLGNKLADGLLSFGTQHGISIRLETQSYYKHVRNSVKKGWLICALSTTNAQIQAKNE
jgi:hypothetical protein